MKGRQRDKPDFPPMIRVVSINSYSTLEHQRVIKIRLIPTSLLSTYLHSEVVSFKPRTPIEASLVRTYAEEGHQVLHLAI